MRLSTTSFSQGFSSARRNRPSDTHLASLRTRKRGIDRPTRESLVIAGEDKSRFTWMRGIKRADVVAPVLKCIGNGASPALIVRFVPPRVASCRYNKCTFAIWVYYQQPVGPFSDHFPGVACARTYELLYLLHRASRAQLGGFVPRKPGAFVFVCYRCKSHPPAPIYLMKARAYVARRSLFRRYSSAIHRINADTGVAYKKKNFFNYFHRDRGRGRLLQ